MPPKVVDSTDLNRGKYFAEICDRLFPGLSNKAIGEALGGYPESTIRTWKAGTSIGNTAIYHLSKMGVAMPFLFKGEGAMLVGDQNTPPAEASGDLAQKTLTAVFQTQAALSAFGQHLVSGQSAKAF
ncbi:MAG: hypothetical protein LUC93_03645, partial [Planctomycetaceae bacterium]|nr:hypothetical protein [Planctomycetaceae bacterium]